MVEGRSRYSTWIVWLLATIASLSFAFAYATKPEVSDPYEFLSGQTLIASGAMFPMDCYLGADESAYYLSEYRSYSWEADYKFTKDLIARELRGHGFTLEYDKGDFCSWSKPGNFQVLLQAGRTYTRDQAIRNKPVDPGVTVTCGNEIPYTWTNRFRAWIEPPM